MINVRLDITIPKGDYCREGIIDKEHPPLITGWIFCRFLTVSKSCILHCKSIKYNAGSGSNEEYVKCEECKNSLVVQNVG